MRKILLLIFFLSLYFTRHKNFTDNLTKQNRVKKSSGENEEVPGLIFLFLTEIHR